MMGGVFAQEAEPTPTNTDTPSPVSLDTATATDTETLTDTAIDTQTDTPTHTAFHSIAVFSSAAGIEHIYSRVFGSCPLILLSSLIFATEQLLISTGNITNTALETIILLQMDAIAGAFVEKSFIELNRSALIVHR